MSFSEDESTDLPPFTGKSAGDETELADDPPDGSTGLPWPRTWPGVYLFVVGCFVTWVTLMVVLERVFP